MRNITLLAILLLLHTSCMNNKKPKIVRDQNENSGLTEFKRDSTLIEIADLPIQIEGTDYLIHPIGEYEVYQTRSDISYSSTGYDFDNFSASYSDRNEITGNFNNIKFQHFQSEHSYPLTDKLVKIKSISFLREIFNKTKEQYLVYKIIDEDTNKDKKLDFNDIETLYISKIDGKNLTKLTPEYQELIDWKTIVSKNRLYFRSVEDTNKNGEFDREDLVHYHFMDLSGKNWKVVEYKPI